MITKITVMKKILWSLLASVAFTTLCQAQTDKGDWMVGGSFLINTSKRAPEVTVTPSVGHFFANNLAFGGEMIISYNKIGVLKTTELGAGIFGRLYFNIKESSFKPLIHTSFNVGSLRTKDTTGSITETVTGFILGAGGAFFINSNVAIDGLAGYSYKKVENTPGGGGFLFRLGFQVHLLRREVGRN